jgi:uncharacterized membrane protein
MNRPIGAAFNILLMLFSSAGYRIVDETNIRRWLRHPQLTGCLSGLWATCLPMVICLAGVFGGIGLWAASSILLLNRRDGPWKKTR